MRQWSVRVIAPNKAVQSVEEDMKIDAGGTGSGVLSCHTE
jgi:predicted RNA methylase